MNCLFVIYFVAHLCHKILSCRFYLTLQMDSLLMLRFSYHLILILFVYGTISRRKNLILHKLMSEFDNFYLRRVITVNH